MMKKVFPLKASVPCAMYSAGCVVSPEELDGVKVRLTDLPVRSRTPAASANTVAAVEPTIEPVPLPPKPLVVGMNDVAPRGVRSRIAPGAIFAFAPVPNALALLI